MATPPLTNGQLCAEGKLSARDKLTMDPSHDAKSDKPPTGVSTPRRVQDIHLDGTVDDMNNVDPYLLDEKDLDIQSEVGGVAGTASSNVSLASWKSLNLQKAKASRSVVASTERTDTSRARRLKQHERSPFLSIDVPSTNNSARSNAFRAKSKSPQYGSQISLLSMSTSGLVSERSGRSSLSDRTRSARDQGHKLLSSTTMMPPGNLPRQPNHNVKKPFKHDVKQVDLAVPLISPAMDLTDRTAIATHAINKILLAQKPTRTRYIQGKLLKARLKPMEPVKMTEPTIHQCRGIVSETRSYSQCDSRTLQRWKAIMSGAQVPPRQQEAVRDGASTSESIHRTSEASTPDLMMDDFDAGMFVDKAWMEELNGVMNGDSLRPPTDGPDNSLAFTSLPNSRAGPTHCDDGLALIPGPDFEIVEDRVPSLPNVDTDCVQDDIQVDDSKQTSPPTDPKQPVEFSKGEASNESGISVTTEESGGLKFSDDTESQDKDSQVAGNPVNKRPHSATYAQELAVPKTPSILRPKTATGTSHKAVRFADQGSKKSSTKSAMGRLGKESRKDSKGRSSCRPASLDSGFDDRHDPGDGGSGRGGGRGGGGGGTTFLTEESIKGTSTTTGGESTTSEKTGGSSSHQGGKSKTVAIILEGEESPNEDSIPRVSINQLGREENCDKKLCSSQSQSACDEYGVNLVIDDANFATSMRDKTVTASVVYTEGKESTATKPSETLSKTKSKEPERRSLVKNTGTKRGETPLLEKSSAVDVGIESQAFMETTDKHSPSDNLVLHVSGEKLDVAKGDKTYPTSLIDQNYNYDKYSRVAQNKRLSSSARKAKAYQNLIKRTSKDVLPVTGTFMGRSGSAGTTNRRGNHQRPSSTSSFSERSYIESKHGLLNSKTRPSSTPSKPAGQSSKTQKNTKKESFKSDSPYNEAINDGVDKIMSKTEVDCENTETQFRPKSASRVTFADEMRVKPHVPNSSSSSVRRHNKKQPRGAFGSSDSLHTQFTGSHADDGILGEDFNLMWEEIPSYDSDDEEEEDANEEEDSTQEEEENFGLISKFQDLDAQFELLKCEMTQERQKFNTNCLLSEEVKAIEGTDFTTECLSSPTNASATNGANENDTVNFTEPDSRAPRPIFVTSEEHLEESSSSIPHNVSSLPHPLENSSVLRDEQEVDKSDDEPSVFISPNLYKKTHLYVEVSTLNTRHKERSVSQISTSRKSKAMKCVPVEEAELSHVERNDNAESTLLRLDESGVKDQSQNHRETTISISTNVGPFLSNYCLNNISRDENNDNYDKNNNTNNNSSNNSGSENSNCDNDRFNAGQNSSDHKSVLSTLRSSNNVKVSKSSSCKVKNNSDKGGKRRNKNATLSSSSLKQKTKSLSKSKTKVSQKVAECSNYADILLAYRQHCMEDTEDETDEEDESDGKIEENTFIVIGVNRGSLSSSTQPPIELVEKLNLTENVIDGSKGSYDDRKINTVCLTQEQSDNGDKDKAWTGQELVNVKGEQLKEMGPISDGELQSKANKTTHKQGNLRSSKPTPPPLEIVAKSKKFSKLMKPASLSDVDMTTLCKLPPLCFQLNARPPSGFLYYFAYDQNMNPNRLSTYLNTEHPPPRFWALLFGFKLSFNMKVPGLNLNDADVTEGHANLEFNPNSSVEGCVYQVTPEQLTALDRFMGYPQHWEHVVLPVWMSNCHDSDQLGLAQYCVPALTFVAKDACTCQGPVIPNSFAVEQCLKGADIVSPQYREHLQSFLPSETTMVLKAIEAA